MVPIFVAAYLVISLPIALLLWTVLAIAKRGDEKSLASLGDDRRLESKTGSITFYSL
jgi:hypothetical protein